MEKNDYRLYYTSHFGSVCFAIASSATQPFDTATDALSERDAECRCKRIFVLRRAAGSAKTLARRQSRSYNPLKPMAQPGAPVVRLAERPVFESSPPAKPATSVRHIPAHKVNQAELDRLLAISSAPSAAPVSEPAKTVDIEPVAPLQLPYARTCLLYTSPSPRDQRGSRMPSSA